MSKMKGMKCLVKIVEGEDASKVLAGQRSATLNRSAETLDGTSKDSEGGWTENLQGFKEWSVDCDGALVESDEAYDHLEAQFEAGEPVNVIVELASGKQYEGPAIITDFPIEMPYDDLATYSISLTGAKALNRTPVA